MGVLINFQAVLINSMGCPLYFWLVNDCYIQFFNYYIFILIGGFLKTITLNFPFELEGEDIASGFFLDLGE